MTQVTAILQEQVETTGNTKFWNRWQVKGKYHRLFNTSEEPKSSAYNGINTLAFVTFAPVFQTHEGDTISLTSS